MLYQYYSYSTPNTRGYEYRRTHVPGVRKHRGGNGYFRKIRTHAERTQNQVIDQDEPSARCKRRDRNLPQSWDDIGRTRQRCWKEQRRGRKAWER